MSHTKRLARARRKAKAMRLARWQGVPTNTAVPDSSKWAWLMGRAR